MSIPTFQERLNGRFDGMIRLIDVEQLQDKMAQTHGWYLVQPNDPLPEQTVDGKTASAHLADLVTEILKEERGIWTTMVYVQEESDEPWIVKVYHPRRAGCGCGTSQAIVPWWVITRMRPELVPTWQAKNCAIGAGQQSKRSAWLKNWS